MMNIFQTDMIEEILLRLPVKSLLRFKCVSKNWCDLIGSRRFTDLHDCHDSNQDRLIFEIIDYPQDRFEAANGDRLWLPHPHKARWRMGPVNGIFCEVGSRGHIILWNPATHMIKVVPVPPAPELYDLAFGFGLDPSSGDYKIVAFDTSDFACVYSWSSDCWKRIDIESVGSRILIAHQGNWHAAFSNGVYYWPVVLLAGLNNFSILAFDMMTEKFGEIIVPDGLIGRIRMAVCGDSIGLLAWYELWVLGKQGCWSKCFEFSALGWHMSPLYVWKNEMLILDETNSDLIGIDVTTRKVRRVEAPFKWCDTIFSIFSYKESFVSI